MKFKWLSHAALASILATLPHAAASAETLREALAAAYATNPDLTSQRAALRVLDERVEQARAGGRPSIGATVGLVQDFQGLGRFTDDGRTFTANANLQLPLFQGGRVKNAVRAADQRVLAGRESLRGVENQVFLDVVSAYMDVVRDQAVVELNANQVRVLQEQLRASRDRFEVGDLTRTDVAQSEARLATAQSALTAAQGQLTVSREAYRRVVGRVPGTLEPPPPLTGLPGSAAQAVDLAVAENPQLIAARLAENATRYDVSVARAGRLPTLTGTTGVRYQNALGTLDNIRDVPAGTFENEETSQTIGLSATVPLYQSGAVASQIREAQARRSQAIEEIILAERQVVENVRAAFAQLETAQAVIKSSEVAVKANELALEGTRQENLVGARTVLDVLDAEQELLNTRVDLVRARRDEYVAGFALLAAIGRAEAEDLGLEVAHYDPEGNYRRIRNSWSDWSTGPAPTPQATRTVESSTTPVTSDGK